MWKRITLIGLSVVIGDPAGKLSPFNEFDIRNDPFGIMGAQFDLKDYKIRWRLAKQFKKDSFANVASYMMKIKKKVRPNFMGLETNNNGGDILKLFHRKYGLTYIHGINMSNNLTEKTRSKGFSTDKNFMTHWFKEKMNDGLFEFPDSPTEDMQEFIDQIAKIVPVMTSNGSTTYRAYRGQHDDLFMAGLHVCNIIRLFIEEQEKLK